MQIALIGASGFIGGALQKEALARGHQVRALVTRGCLKFKTGHYEMAITDLTAALKLDPSCSLAVYVEIACVCVCACVLFFFLAVCRRL